MSICEDGISGFGKELSNGDLAIIAMTVTDEKDVTEDEVDNLEWYEIFKKAPLHPLVEMQGGNAFSGESRWYLAVKGNTPKEIVLNTDAAVEKFNELGLDLKEEDLYMFDDVYVS